MGYTFTSSRDYLYRPGMLFLGRWPGGAEVGVQTERHALTAAGSRSGKGVALLIQNARKWTENILVIDPKGEAAENAWLHREALGQRVVVLDPFKVANVPPDLRARFNPLAEIDGDTEPGRTMVAAIADGLIVSHNKEHMQWTEAARKIWAGVLAYVIAEAPKERRNFATARNLLMQPKEDLYNTAQTMEIMETFGGIIRNAGKIIRTALESDRGLEKDALGMAQSHTLWLDEPAIKSSLEGETFKLSNLKNGWLSLFLVLPPDRIAPYAGFLRLFVKTALTTMAQGGAGKGRRCLFLLDEFYSLGQLSDISNAAGLMPGYGVHLWPFVQNLGQITELYGSTGLQAFRQNSDALIFFENREDAAYVSAQVGVIAPHDLPTMEPPIKEPFDQWILKNLGGFSGFLLETDKARRERHETDYINRVTQYNAKQSHMAKDVGRPHLAPEEIREITAKKTGNKHSTYMIVLTKGDDVLKVMLEPYWTENPPPRTDDRLIEDRRNEANERFLKSEEKRLKVSKMIEELKRNGKL